ncbi:MAG TPA: lysophospholipid acyltransferase family protein [Pyrinomonadaceae bacterium]|jgi:1-acyl-sn-glycerol-3-phosphate acyltransferase
MLEAKKSAWFESIFAIYNRNLLKRRFNSLQISGLDVLRKKSPDIPAIIYTNHSSWWDGLVAFQISYQVKADSFVMMEEKHLKKMLLFRKLGAFSVVREKPFEAAKSIDYAVNLLKEKPKRVLWIFPQGEILPNDLRPLMFYKGISKIIAKSGKCLLIPAVFRYEFLGEYKPEIFIRIGETELFENNLKITTEHLEYKTTLFLDKLKSDILNKNFNEFEKIF